VSVLYVSGDHAQSAAGVIHVSGGTAFDDRARLDASAIHVSGDTASDDRPRT